MWGPNDGMSPFNPNSAPNKLREGDRQLQAQGAKALQDSRSFMDRMNGESESPG